MYQNGYTVIELIIVITLITTLFIISPLSRSIYRSLETIVAVKNIVIDLRWARYSAIDDNRDYKLRVYRRDDIYIKDNNTDNDYIIYDSETKKVIKEGTFPGYLIVYKNLNEKKITDDYYDRIKFFNDGTALHGTIGFCFGSKIYKIVVSRLGRIRIAR